MNRFILAALVFLLPGGASLSAQPEQYPFRNPNLPIEQRIDNILSLMTLDEKIACFGASSAVSRLGIPNAGATEGLHGLVRRGRGDRPGVPTTQFGQAIGMAETWDTELMRRAGEVEGIEARYLTQSAKYHAPALVVWAPNADLARDPRWGRTEESFGEDPFLNGTMATAFIRGLQGNDPKYWQAASLLKHFMANSNEDDRRGSTSDFDVRLMREYYTVPFRMAYQDGGARAFMESYNAWNKVPMTAHPIVKQLIKEWNIDGIISTDAGGERYMVTFHKIYKSLAEAAAATVKTGTNQILDPYDKPLHEAIENKLITEAELDSALRGKFRTVIRLGLLDPPEMVLYTKIKDGEEPWNTEKHKAVARATSLESIVLLKNARNFLPLKKESIRSIAVIGPRANEVQYDYYSGPAPYLVTPLDGIKARLGSKVTVNYAADNTGDAAVKAAKASDVAVVVVGNHPWCGVDRDAPKTWEESNTVPCTLKSEGREGRDRYSLTLEAEELVKQVYAANPKTIVVIVTSFPYAIVWSEEHVPAILRATHSAQELGNSLAGVIFGDFNPSGKLTSTWVRSLDQLPPMLDYNIRNGRTYMYQKTKPLYPFGFGLSYTTFKYSNLRTSAPSLKAGAEVTVSVDVRNTGSREGAEVVQLYFSHQKSSVQRPIKELGGFARVSLKPGETKTVQIPLKAQQLAYWDEGKNGWVVEEEPVKIMAGASSADMRLEKTLPVVK